MLPRVGWAEVSLGGDRPRGNVGRTAGQRGESRRFGGSGQWASCAAGPRSHRLPRGPLPNPRALQPLCSQTGRMTQEEAVPVPVGVEPREGQPGFPSSRVQQLIARPVCHPAEAAFSITCRTEHSTCERALSSARPQTCHLDPPLLLPGSFAAAS